LLLHNLRQIEWAGRKAIGFLSEYYRLADVAPGCSSVATTPYIGQLQVSKDKKVPQKQRLRIIQQRQIYTIGSKKRGLTKVIA